MLIVCDYFVKSLETILIFAESTEVIQETFSNEVVSIEYV